MQILSSADNPHIKTLKKLIAQRRARHDARLMVLDGIHLLDSALRADCQPTQVFISESGTLNDEITLLQRRVQGAKLYVLPDRLFATLTELGSPTGIFSVLPWPVLPARSPIQTLVLLDDVQDPGNVGTILRTAAAAGVDAVYLSPGCADAWSSKVLRAGMGAHFSVQIYPHADLLATLAAFDGQVVTTVLNAPTSLYATDLCMPTAWLFGNEGAGVSRDLIAASDTPVHIPMPGHAESLNVAASVAIGLFEQIRQRQAR